MSTLISACIFAQYRSPAQQELITKWQNAKTYALKMAELMPEGKYNFKPVEEEMSFGEQLLHIASNIKWLSSSYLLFDSVNTTKVTSTKISVILKELASAYDDGLAAQLRMPVNQLDSVVKFFVGPMTRRQIVNLIHDHQCHHVGQKIVYLRLNGIKPPAYMGW